MKEADIRKYASLMKELELTGLEIKEDQHTVRLERVGFPAQTVIPVPTPSAPASQEAEAFENGNNWICSPMVGVFYAASAENAEPFVHVGDFVKKGSVLCVIEAMKLMNELVAEQDGTIVEICAQNGQTVDYGCELFRIRR